MPGRRKPPLPRTAGRRTAADRRSIARQMRVGESISRASRIGVNGARASNAYHDSWPRDHAGRFTERCTGRRSRCEIAMNDPANYGLYRERDRERRRAGYR